MLLKDGFSKTIFTFVLFSLGEEDKKGACAKLEQSIGNCGNWVLHIYTDFCKIYLTVCNKQMFVIKSRGYIIHVTYLKEFMTENYIFLMKKSVNWVTAFKQILLNNTFDVKNLKCAIFKNEYMCSIINFFFSVTLV